jgi:hypothetical protein
VRVQLEEQDQPNVQQLVQGIHIAMHVQLVHVHSDGPILTLVNKFQMVDGVSNNLKLLINFFRNRVLQKRHLVEELIIKDFVFQEDVHGELLAM